ncbi:MAG TPA: fimbria/pilus outer membrane usher protein [Thermoanaerobaculia bacterium]|nr:fimbria/pilus outer membrane usher protein [Thermoanaerobaculia bacterium]
MAVLSVLATTPARAQSKEILLPLTFNEVAKGDVPALIEGEDVFMKPADLEKLGATGSMWTRLVNFARLYSGARRKVGDTQFISLKVLAPYLTYKIDPATLSLAISVNPQLLAPTNLNVQLGPPPDIVYTHNPSTFFNYSLTDQPGTHPSFFGETGTSIGGNLVYNSFARTNDARFVRLLSSYTLDERQSMRRWTAGDASVVTDLLGGSALIGGVTVQRNFGLDPYFVRYPPLNFSGTALTPSRVEVYVNGALVSQQEVPPGPFQLANIPVASGAGNAQIVIRDVFGREQTINQPYYYSTGVLEKGLSEFVYSAGFVRDNFGTSSFDYGSPALMGFHRLGLTDALTAGGRFEASRDLISGGPNVSMRTRIGEIDFSVAGSDDHGRVGEAASFGYQYLARRMSVGGFARAFSREYANVSMRSDADRPLLDTSIFVTFLASRASLSLLWNKSDMRDSVDTDSISLLTNVPVTRRVSLFLSVGSANQGNGRKPQAFAGLTYFFGGTTSASITVDHQDGKTQTITEVSRTLPVGTGFGYRFQSAMADGGTHTGSGAVQYQTDFGRYEVDFDPYRASVRPTITAAGGVVYESGSLMPARAVQDSFALVRVPGVEGVRVYASNNLIGRTDSNGDVLVPTLLAYYGNRLSIDDRDIPMNYEVSETEKTIAPPYRGGAFVPFGVRAIRTVSGTVRVKDIVPAFGELTLTQNGKSFDSPLGHNGEFYFENLPSGTYDASIEYRDGTCRFRLDIPAGNDPVVKLGQKTCTP